MNPVIKQDNDRLKLFKKYGYDIPKARSYIIAKAGLNRGGTMLEVGTGRGHMATALARKGFKLTSIDLDKKAQSIAKMHLKEIKNGKSAILKIMNAERLRFKDGSFDQVISVNFIHHAKNPAKCLKEMVRVARNRLIIADINKRGERIMDKVHRLDGHNHALSKMSLKEMEALLKNAGMQVKVYKDTCQTVLIAKKRRIKMKICVPTEHKEGLSAKVHGHFGSAQYFTIYDTEKKTVSTIDNTNAHHSHGMCHPIGVLGAASIDVVVCQGMGMRAVQKLNEGGIKAYQAAGDTVADVIKKYENKELKEITVENACAQHGCH